MRKSFNQKGFSLIGIVLAILIIAAIGYGNLFFYKQKKQTEIYRNAYDKAEEDITDINNKVDEINEIINDATEEIKKDEPKSDDSEKIEDNEIEIYPQ